MVNIALIFCLFALLNVCSSKIIVPSTAITTHNKHSWKMYASRFPSAIKDSSVNALKSFTSNSLFLIPIGVAGAAFSSVDKSMLTIFRLGCTWGCQMSSYSASYAGSETFCRLIRGVDDKYNRIIGSGMSSAILRLNNGVLDAADGFVKGSCFMYVFDTFLMPKSKEIGKTQVNSHQSPTPPYDSIPNRIFSFLKTR